MRSNNPTRWPIRLPLRRTAGAGVALLAGLVVVACSNTVVFGPPEEPDVTGFEGDWVGTFQETEMVLRIGDFGTGRTAPGEVIWGDVTWDLLCTVTITPESSDIECDVLPDAEEPFCGDPDPYVDIEIAEPRERLEASVGGILREGTETQCDGAVIVSWEPGAGVVFTPG